MSVGVAMARWWRSRATPQVNTTWITRKTEQKRVSASRGVGSRLRHAAIVPRSTTTHPSARKGENHG